MIKCCVSGLAWQEAGSGWRVQVDWRDSAPQESGVPAAAASAAGHHFALADTPHTSQVGSHTCTSMENTTTAQDYLAHHFCCFHGPA